MKRRISELIACMMLLLMSASAIAASGFHSLEDIRQIAKQFALNQYIDPGADTSVEVGYLDTRLRLRQCEQALTAEPLSRRSQNANFTITVKCQGVKPWSVYVPVKVMSFVEVQVANRPLARGIAVQATDLVTERREVSRLRTGYFVSTKHLIGRLPKRSLPKGAVISPNDLATYKVIRRGGKVSILAEVQGIAVRMPGKALADAGQDEMIKVQNLSSKRVIDAIAIKPGIVRVPM